MDLFFLKLLLTPILIATATLASRYWGPVVGGWIVGLPLTSGPVSVFLALERGPEFAAGAAHSTLLGTLAVVAYCLTYARSAGKVRWSIALALSFACYLSSLGLLSLVTLPLAVSTVLVTILVGVALRFVGPTDGEPPAMVAPWWDLPFRMLAATSIVVVITTLSPHLGPQLSGLFSAFPVFISVMSVFAHSLHGAGAVRQFERGVIAGSFSYIAFFVTISLTVRIWSLPLVYAAACLNAIVINLAALKLLVREKKAAT